jgi:hypothetical protein
MYQGRIAVLLATDPSGPQGDRLIAFQLIEGKVLSEHVSSFFERIRAIGIHPHEIVTDGSNLYPDVVRKIWPSASHQLCLFHKTHSMVLAVGKAVSHLRSELPKVPSGSGRGITRAVRAKGMDTVYELRAAGKGIREISRETGHSKNTVKKWLRDSDFVHRHSRFKAGIEVKKEIGKKLTQTQPPPPWQTWEQVRKIKEMLASARYLFSRRAENLSSEQKNIVDEIYSSPIGDSARVISNCVQRWYGIWYGSEKERNTPDEAYSRWKAFIESAETSKSPPLERFSNTLNDELFRKLSVFLHNKTWESTSNGAERYCRRIRHLQRIHYNFRSMSILRSVIEHDAIGCCRGT